MVTEEFKAYADEAIIHTYNRFPVVFHHGEGVYLYDTEGKKYLDFAAGIAVNAFGYNVEEYKNALKDQIDKLMHISNLYFTGPMIEASHKLVKAAGLKRVFFTNSGAEAIEGAIKVARKYAFKKDGCTDHEIIAMEHSFHGRTMGAVSVTGNFHYREAFQPGIGNIVFANFNDLEDVKSKITDKTCAILFETVQGEGGIYPAEKEFIQEIRKICDEKDILLILDEIQCGMGRTGEMFAYQNYGILPDIMTTAKALGCGVPVGGFVVGEKAEFALEPGDHGSTYGGNPFVTAAVSKVFDMFEEKNILEHVREVAPYLDAKLQELVEKYDILKETRGLGLMRALEFNVPVGTYVSKALEKGLVIISAGTNIVRFVPPLVITKENVDEMIGILEECLSE